MTPPTYYRTAARGGAARALRRAGDDSPERWLRPLRVKSVERAVVSAGRWGPGRDEGLGVAHNQRRTGDVEECASGAAGFADRLLAYGVTRTWPLLECLLLRPIGVPRSARRGAALASAEYEVGRAPGALAKAAALALATLSEPEAAADALEAP